MDNQEQVKKAYQAPAFRVVRLEIGTAVLDACRASSSQINSGEVSPCKDPNLGCKTS